MDSLKSIFKRLQSKSPVELLKFVYAGVGRFFRILNKAEYLLLVNTKGSYLKETGWVNSVNTGKVVDENGNPLPWLSYPIIKLLDDRLKPEFEVFEYGSGYSTLFYAQRVQSVSSVENDKIWYSTLQGKLPQNATVNWIELETGGAYSRFPLESDKKFDLIVIDGRDRVSCCKVAPLVLKDNGVIILDNSDRKEYADGVSHLEDKGFKRIDFWGMSPGFTHGTCTALFYRNENCLGV